MTTFEHADRASRPAEGAGWSGQKVGSLGAGAAAFLAMLLLSGVVSSAVLIATAVASIVWLIGAFIR